MYIFKALDSCHSLRQDSEALKAHEVLFSPEITIDQSCNTVQKSGKSHLARLAREMATFWQDGARSCKNLGWSCKNLGAHARILDGLARILDGLARILDGLARILDGLARILDGLARILDGLARILDGRARRSCKNLGAHARILDGLARILDGRARILDGFARILHVHHQSCKKVNLYKSCNNSLQEKW